MPFDLQKEKNRNIGNHWHHPHNEKAWGKKNNEAHKFQGIHKLI